MANFESLCKKIIDTNGRPSAQDVLDCGYGMEHFIKLSQPNVSAEKLIKNARDNLLARGIHYKEA
jgi:hypothetical protein